MPCVDPALAKEDGTDNDIGVMIVSMGRAYKDCKRRHQDLIDFEKAGTDGSK